MDYNRIIVLDQGEVKENGHPFELIQQDGIFKSMCKESGEYQELLEIAKVAYDSKQMR